MSGSGIDANLGFGLGGLVRDGCHDPFDQFAGLDPHRLEFAPPLAGEVEDGGYQAVHLGDRRFDESQRFGKILRKLPVFAVKDRLVLAFDLWHRRSRSRGAAKCPNPPENVAAQFLEFAGKAHDVHQRRAQIVADDIGEALDLVVGLAKIGGALVDRGFEIEVVVAQQGFGVVAGARGAPYQKDRDASQHDNETRTDAGHRRGQGLTAVCTRRAQHEQTIFFRAHPTGQIVDVVHRLAADVLAHDLGGVIQALGPGKFDGLTEFLDPLIAECNHLVQQLPFNGIVAYELAQPC
jgi:hypothetical protein